MPVFMAFVQSELPSGDTDPLFWRLAITPSIFFFHGLPPVAFFKRGKPFLEIFSHSNRKSLLLRVNPCWALCYLLFDSTFQWIWFLALRGDTQCASTHFPKGMFSKGSFQTFPHVGLVSRAFCRGRDSGFGNLSQRRHMLHVR
jgi:hypothetical protein